MIKRWTTHNDANRRNKHAKVNGVQFFAFPYQSFQCSTPNKRATVTDTPFIKFKDGECIEEWIAITHKVYPDGTSSPLDKFVSDNQDDCFIWASEWLK